MQTSEQSTVTPVSEATDAVLARLQARSRSQPAVDPAAARQIQVARAKLAARLGKRYASASLDSFRITHPAQSAVVSRLRSILPRLDDFVRHGHNLIFFGCVGTGKDHLLAAMLYRACELRRVSDDGFSSDGLLCDWIAGQELFGRFRDAMGTDSRESSLVRELQRPDVLAISDPASPMTLKDESWRIEILYRVLDARYRQRKSTWMTLNAASPEEAEERLSSPVFDRLRDEAEMFGCFWPSHRQPAKAGR